MEKSGKMLEKMNSIIPAWLIHLILWWSLLLYFPCATPATPITQDHLFLNVCRVFLQLVKESLNEQGNEEVSYCQKCAQAHRQTAGICLLRFLPSLRCHPTAGQYGRCRKWSTLPTLESRWRGFFLTFCNPLRVKFIRLNLLHNAQGARVLSSFRPPFSLSF